MPKKYASYGWLPLVRKIVLLVLVAFIASIVLIIFLGSKEKKVSRPDPGGVLPDKVQSREENFTALEVTSQGGKIKVRADLASIDEENNRQLKGNVEFFQEKPDFQLILKADQAGLASGWQNLLAKGSVEIKSGDLTLSAPDLTYDLKTGLLQAENLRFDLRSLEISATGATYDLKDRKGQFQKGAVIKINSLEPPLIVSGNRVDFDLKAGLVQAGGLKFNQGSMSGTALGGTLLLDENNFVPEEIRLEGKAFFNLRQMEEASTFSSLNLATAKMILTRQQGSWLLQAPGSWELKAEGRSGDLAGQGEEIELIFNSEGQAVSFLARKAVLLVFDGGEKRLELEGQGLEDNLLTGKISLQASARLTYPEFKLKSKSLELEMSDLSFKANRVKFEISPDFFKLAVSFFKKDRPLTAGGAEASGNRARIDLKGQTVLRQDENVFLAGRASVDRETGMIALSDGIKANLAYRQAGSKIKRAELSAKELSLLPSGLALEARREVNFLSDEFKLQAGRLIFYFERENSDELTRLEADGPVRLSWHDYEFDSKEATYRPAEEVFIFSGLAKLKDKDGNRVEADKLTLFTLDDKITVENQGKKRSVTTLRREK